MASNILEAVAEIGSECYRERDRLRDEVERLSDEVAQLKQDIPEVYRATYFHVAERCVQIADEHASVTGVAQQISHAIRREFGLGDV